MQTDAPLQQHWAGTEAATATEDREFVGELLSRRIGKTVAVVTLKKEPAPSASIFPVEVWTATTVSGEAVPLFVKLVGEEDCAHPDKQFRDREFIVYEKLLQGRDLPVPGYYGSRVNALSCRREIFLEYVPGPKLKYSELEHWFSAARSLGKLHSTFMYRWREIENSKFLLRFDERYFEEWLRRAVAAVTRRSERMAAKLAPAVARFPQAVELICSQPPTLVHNDLSAKNVVVSHRDDPQRIRFVDWEMAGTGSGFLDMVRLKYERLDALNERRFVDAYRHSLDPAMLAGDDEDYLVRLDAACDLHITFFRIAHCDFWGETDAEVERRVDRALRFAQLVD